MVKPMRRINVLNRRGKNIKRFRITILIKEDKLNADTG